MLESQNLIDRGAIQVYIDTYSINKALKSDSSKARKLLQFDRCSDHPKCPIKSFIRTPHQTDFDILKSIQEFDLKTKLDDPGKIEIGNRNIMFQHSELTLIKRTKWLPTEEKYNLEQLDRLKMAVAYTFMIGENTDSIFVTDDELILENRSTWRKPMSRGNVNIMSLEEAFEFLGLYCRRYDLYHYQPKSMAGFSGWYSALMKSEIPHFNGEGEYTRGLREKLKHLLIALDRTGFEYYRGATQGTHLEMAYHFEKGISLIMSIFDILALIAEEKHELNISDHRLLSLSNSRTDGEGNQVLLDELECENLPLNKHTKENQNFIQLIEEVRNLVIHREGFPNTGFHGEDWDANLIRLSDSSIGDNIKKSIDSLGDEELKYKPFTKWGIHSMEGFEDVHLEPHQFLKQSITELMDFTDKFLELCGYENFVQENWEDGERGDVDSVKRLRKYSLKFEFS